MSKWFYAYDVGLYGTCHWAGRLGLDTYSTDRVMKILMQHMDRKEYLREYFISLGCAANLCPRLEAIAVSISSRDDRVRRFWHLD